MTESTAAGVETTQVRLTLPVLHPSQHPREVVSHLQHMFNDIDAAAGRDPVFDETGEYGPKTTNRVKALQREHGLEQTGSVGSGTWQAVLELWLQAETPR
jgi:murein L,D-transpeptidase YcbB/YkuD